MISGIIKSGDRDRDNAIPPSWKSHKAKPQRRRSSIRSQRRAANMTTESLCHPQSGVKCSGRRPSYLIESERIKDSVAEVDEEEMILKTLGRIPMILRRTFSQRSGAQWGKLFRQRLRGRAKEKEMRKQRQKMHRKIEPRNGMFPTLTSL